MCRKQHPSPQPPLREIDCARSGEPHPRYTPGTVVCVCVRLKPPKTGSGSVTVQYRRMYSRLSRRGGVLNTCICILWGVQSKYMNLNSPSRVSTLTADVHYSTEKCGASCRVCCLRLRAKSPRRLVTAEPRKDRHTMEYKDRYRFYLPSGLKPSQDMYL